MARWASDDGTERRFADGIARVPLDRVDAALTHAGVAMWEVYPDWLDGGPEISAEIDQAYCPNCRELVLPNADGSCVWCDAQTGGGVDLSDHAPAAGSSDPRLSIGEPGYGDVCPRCSGRKGKQARHCRKCHFELGQPRRAYRKRNPKPRCMSLEQLEWARLEYAQGRSLNNIAEELWPATSYSSARSCSEGLYSCFKTRGWKLRSQSDVTAARNFKHGRKTRSVTREEDLAYRRWLADQRGRRTIGAQPERPPCKGVKQNPPRKGEPCKRGALPDAEYCHWHDPRRQLQHQAHLAQARRRRRLDLVDIEPFVAAVEALIEMHGTQRAVARLLRVNDTTVLHWRQRVRPTLGRERVLMYLDRAGLSFDDVYAREAIAA